MSATTLPYKFRYSTARVAALRYDARRGHPSVRSHTTSQGPQLLLQCAEKHYVPIATGDWICTGPDGARFRLTDKEFQRIYEPTT